jgi:hypothetical protein
MPAMTSVANCHHDRVLSAAFIPPREESHSRRWRDVTPCERVSAAISRVFRGAFTSHPARGSDPALALASARETAAEALPRGCTGIFDDERLTFTCDPISNSLFCAFSLRVLETENREEHWRAVTDALLVLGWRPGVCREPPKWDPFATDI